jgi:hypothetical protein
LSVSISVISSPKIADTFPLLISSIKIAYLFAGSFAACVHNFLKTPSSIIYPSSVASSPFSGKIGFMPSIKSS